MYKLADRVDRDEGSIAYIRYSTLMLEIANHYNADYLDVTAAFVAMSPNSDYMGNLRSLITMLNCVRDGQSLDKIKVSTFRHARNRAYKYLIGAENFWTTTKGPKIRNFFKNITEPGNADYVTIDGHIVAAWKGKNLTMKQAIIKPTLYRIIADDVKEFAQELRILPNQLQATLWFARKRLYAIKVPHADLFLPRNDQWRIMHRVSQIRPYV